MQRRPSVSIFLAILAILASCSSPSTSTSAFAGSTPERQPVVVELFSSEGCSSCPPADLVLSRLDKESPEVIALELHVDYWNYLGWEDPFSSAAFTARQRAYASAMGQRGMYTPQMIVDGRTEFTGSQAEVAKKAIAGAAHVPKAKVTLQRKDDRVSVAVGELPDAGEAASVWLAITEGGLTTAVPRGENAGATLAHGPVVRSLKRIGGIAAGTKGPAFSGDAPVSLAPGWRRDNLRAVAFVQRDKTLHIVGAAALALK